MENLTWNQAKQISLSERKNISHKFFLDTQFLCVQNEDVVLDEEGTLIDMEVLNELYLSNSKFKEGWYVVN